MRSRRHLLYAFLIGALITAAGFLLARLDADGARPDRAAATLGLPDCEAVRILTLAAHFSRVA